MENFFQIADILFYVFIFLINSKNSSKLKRVRHFSAIWKKSIIRFISTCAYVGYSPIAPGTLGSVMALIPMIFLNHLCLELGRLIAVSIVLISSIGGIWITDYASKKIFYKKDPSEIVIDEFAGMSLSLCFLPFCPNDKTIFLYIFAFAMFRLLDIKKPFFIDKLQNLPGGLGIMADDLAAGLITLIAVQFLKFFLEIVIP